MPTCSSSPPTRRWPSTTRSSRIDHRGHGRGLRSAEAVRARGRGRRRGCPARGARHRTGDHRRLLDGWADQHAADSPPPRPRVGQSWCRRRRWSGARTLRRAGAVEDACDILGPLLRSVAYPRWLRYGIRRLLGKDHPIADATCRGSQASCAATTRSGHRAGRAGAQPLRRPDLGRRRCGKPAASLITTRDRLVRPRKQRALADALGADVIELRRRPHQPRGFTRASSPRPPRHSSSSWPPSRRQH